MFTLEEQVKVSNTCFISLGNYCLTSMLLKENNIKNESYFDKDGINKFIEILKSFD